MRLVNEASSNNGANARILVQKALKGSDRSGSDSRRNGIPLSVRICGMLGVREGHRNGRGARGRRSARSVSETSCS